MRIAVLILGILGILIGLAISGVSFGLHLANRPRISLEEALPGILGGCCCSSLAFAIALGGLLWMLLGGKPPQKRDDDG